MKWKEGGAITPPVTEANTFRMDWTNSVWIRLPFQESLVLFRNVKCDESTDWVDGRFRMRSTNDTKTKNVIFQLLAMPGDRL